MNECTGSVGKVKIPYYVVVKERGYWRPHPRMRALGFGIIRCGPDGPHAWEIAAEWNERWQAVRVGDAPAPIDVSKLSRDQAEVVRRYPGGSVGAAFQAYIRTPEWAARALSARNKVWWPSWYRIRDMWGDVAPDTITFDMMSRWRAALEKKHSRSVAHKTFRVWRALWTIMQGMKVARGIDPSRGVRNHAPAPAISDGLKARPRASSSPPGAPAMAGWRASSRFAGTPNFLRLMLERCALGIV